MELHELTEKMQILCHEGYSNAEVVADIKGFTTAIIERLELDAESERVLLGVSI